MFCFSSDVDKKQCCKTPPLKSALSNDWKANAKATLGEAFFGPCNGTKFLVKQNFVSIFNQKNCFPIVKTSDSQPGCRSKLDCRQLVPGVPQFIKIPCSLYLFHHLGVPPIVYNKGWETLV